MTIQDALAGSGLERLDAEVLLSELLKKNRTWLLAHATDEFPAEHEIPWIEWIERRKKDEPVAYIVGFKEFRGRKFSVDPRVLIPRPATELLVDAAEEWLEVAMENTVSLSSTAHRSSIRLRPTQTDRQGVSKRSRMSGLNFVLPIDPGIVAWAERIRDLQPKILVDIGTGSGCIAISLALELPNYRIIATDLQTTALDVARLNAKNLSAAIEFREGSELEPIMDLDEPFLIISNPPYIPKNIELMDDVRNHEPHSALFSGEKGIDVLKTIVEQARAHPYCAGFVLECRAEQPKLLAKN